MTTLDSQLKNIADSLDWIERQTTLLAKQSRIAKDKQPKQVIDYLESKLQWEHFHHLKQSTS